MLIRFSIFSLLISSYFCSAMDEDPKGKKELVPLLPQSHEIYSVPQIKEMVKFENDNEKELYKELFKTLRLEEQKIIETKIRRLYLFDEVHGEYEYLQTKSFNLGNKELTIPELWQIPRKERLELINRLTPSMLRWSETLTDQEFDKISQGLPVDVKKNLSLSVVKDDFGRKCLPIGISFTFFFAGLGAEIYMLVHGNVEAGVHVAVSLVAVAGIVVGYYLKKPVENDSLKTVSYSDGGDRDDESNDMNIQIDSD